MGGMKISCQTTRLPSINIRLLRYFAGKKPKTHHRCSRSSLKLRELLNERDATGFGINYNREMEGFRDHEMIIDRPHDPRNRY